MNRSEEIKILWDSGLGVTEIGKSLKISHGYVSRVVTKIYGKNRERRYKTKYRIHKINEDYFEKIDSEDKAYFLGLLAADGCLSSDGNTISIGLKEDDIEILQEFNKYLEYSRKLTFIDRSRYILGSNTYLLTITSQKLKKDLEKLGLTNRKSLTLKFFSELPINLMHHYIRGFFDGDGCIYNGGKVHHAAQVSIVSSLDFCKELNNYLNNLNISARLSKHRTSDCYYTVISGANNILRFYNYLYNDSHIFLKRKKEKFDKWIDFRLNNKGSHNKPILQFTKDGKFVKQWTTGAMAARFLNKKSADSAISLCCNGKAKTAYGFYWQYKNK